MTNKQLNKTKTLKTMAQDIFYFDAAGYGKEVREIESGIEKMQLLLDEFNSLGGLFKLSGIADLVNLANGGEEYCKKRIGEEIQPKAFGIFKQSVTKIVETLELPSFVKLNVLALQCSEGIRLSQYMEISNGNVRKNAWELEQLKDRYTKYADTPEKKNLYREYISAASAMQRLHKAIKTMNGVGIISENDIKVYFEITGDDVSMNNLFFNSRDGWDVLNYDKK